jgi:hypothetical protein
VTAGVGLLLFVVAATLLGLAASRTRTLPRWAGRTFAASALVFVLSFLFFDLIQPAGGLGVAVAGVGFLMGARREATTESPAV